MNNSKIIGKKTMFAAVVVAALTAGSASADETPPGANNAHTPGTTPTSTTLMGQNFTKGCVRFYVNGQRDVQAGKSSNFGTVAANKQFMASVYQNGCGGAAVKNVWFKTSGAQATNWWTIR
ncbi:signal peptidase [Duganella sp. BJB488]|uniref:signal peptidase n=1 Tax=unclassified Duganella TaxID=2636909 RepID=UPI000E350A47|nr:MULTISPECIES: signal peptidase [unclassified Duganella]RFP09370.1 signal peptidase [Duganella sp. BJB475]RFP13132.1 signal peptidase [Duganella sp. BJB489]RFP17104.1 signal peptidase [Duganella sp. BJB488]RFP25466.1 signal peptidase [Duganella sp. BJB476]RFP31709.1 signal peptidase [Duganella sp. BJB480]